MQTLPGPAVGDYCLTVRQPFAALIMAGAKRVENRSWPTRFRGRLWIHAAATRPSGGWSDVLEIPGPPVGPDEEVDITEGGLVLPAFRAMALGAVVGSVELVDCVDESDLPAEWADDSFAGGPVCWLLRDPRPLAEPIRKSGALSLWRWK